MCCHFTSPRMRGSPDRWPPSQQNGDPFARPPFYRHTGPKPASKVPTSVSSSSSSSSSSSPSPPDEPLDASLSTALPAVAALIPSADPTPPPDDVAVGVCRVPCVSCVCLCVCCVCVCAVCARDTHCHAVGYRYDPVSPVFAFLRSDGWRNRRGSRRSRWRSARQRQ